MVNSKLFHLTVSALCIALVASSSVSAKKFKNLPENARILIVSSFDSSIEFVATGPTNLYAASFRTFEMDFNEIESYFVDAITRQNAHSGYEFIAGAVTLSIDPGDGELSDLREQIAGKEYDAVLHVFPDKKELGDRVSASHTSGQYGALGSLTGSLLAGAMNKARADSRRTIQSIGIHKRNYQVLNNPKKPRQGHRVEKEINIVVPAGFTLYDHALDKKLAKSRIVEQMPVRGNLKSKAITTVSMVDIDNLAATIERTIHATVFSGSRKLGFNPRTVLREEPEPPLEITGVVIDPDYDPLDDPVFREGEFSFEEKIRAKNAAEAKSAFLLTSEQRCPKDKKIVVVEFNSKFFSVAKQKIWGSFDCADQ